MTMRLKVTNEDAQRVAVVSTIEMRVRADTGVEPFVAESAELGPGESRDFWIHAGRSLKIEELSEAGE